MPPSTDTQVVPADVRFTTRTRYSVTPAGATTERPGSSSSCGGGEAGGRERGGHGGRQRRRVRPRVGRRLARAVGDAEPAAEIEHVGRQAGLGAEPRAPARPPSAAARHPPPASRGGRAGRGRGGPARRPASERERVAPDRARTSSRAWPVRILACVSTAMSGVDAHEHVLLHAAAPGRARPARAASSGASSTTSPAPAASAAVEVVVALGVAVDDQVGAGEPGRAGERDLAGGRRRRRRGRPRAGPAARRACRSPSARTSARPPRRRERLGVGGGPRPQRGGVVDVERRPELGRPARRRRSRRARAGRARPSPSRAAGRDRARGSRRASRPPPCASRPAHVPAWAREAAIRSARAASCSGSGPACRRRCGPRSPRRATARRTARRPRSGTRPARARRGTACPSRTSASATSVATVRPSPAAAAIRVAVEADPTEGQRQHVERAGEAVDLREHELLVLLQVGVVGQRQALQHGRAAPSAARSRPPTLPRTCSAICGFFFCGIMLDPCATASSSSANPNSCDVHSTSSSAIRDRCTAASVQAYERSTAKSRSATASTRVREPAGEAELLRHPVRVERQAGAAERAGAERRAIGCRLGRAQPCHVALQGPRVRRQVVTERHAAGRAGDGCSRAARGRRRHRRGPPARPAGRPRRPPARAPRRRAHSRNAVATWSLRERPACTRLPSRRGGPPAGARSASGRPRRARRRRAPRRRAHRRSQPRRRPG